MNEGRGRLCDHSRRWCSNCGRRANTKTGRLGCQQGIPSANNSAVPGCLACGYNQVGRLQLRPSTPAHRSVRLPLGRLLEQPVGLRAKCGGILLSRGGHRRGHSRTQAPGLSRGCEAQTTGGKLARPTLLEGADVDLVRPRHGRLLGQREVYVGNLIRGRHLLRLVPEGAGRE